MTALRTLAGRSSQGVLTSKPRASERATSSRAKYSIDWVPRQGAMAPSARDSVGSGISSSSSTSSLVPRPVQAGHAPNGELNENDRGSSSSQDRLSYKQARWSE